MTASEDADTSSRAWLLAANREWAQRNESDNLRWRARLAIQCGKTDGWRSIAVTSWVWLLAGTGVWEFHWPRWSYVPVVVGGGLIGAGLRVFLLRRDRRRSGVDA